MPHIEANGIRLYYEIHGQGPPLVLIEGLGYASWMWFRQIGPLSAFHRLLVYDNRGVGESDKPESEYAVRDMAEDLAALLDGLAIARVHLLGVSLGGFIAQQFALSHPERVDRLVLTGTGFGWSEMVPIPEDTLRLMVPDPSLPPEERLRQAMAPAFPPGYAEAHPEVVEAIVQMRLASMPPPGAWVAQARASAGFDAAGQVGAIVAPTLVIHGDADRVVPVENARLLARRLPHAELLILTGGGHLVFIEQADRFNRAVLDFLL